MNADTQSMLHVGDLQNTTQGTGDLTGFDPMLVS